jgi:hypothetical protein
MSTGIDHETNHISFESIDRHVRSFDLTALTSQGAVQQSKADRLTTTYDMVRPILLVVAAIPLIPANWRAALRVFVATLDDVTALFKAGKDLAAGNAGATVEMEPKLPVG